MFPNGNLCVGTTPGFEKFEVAGDAWKSTGGGNWKTTSDRRIKDNVAPFTDSLPVLRQIHPVSFIYNGKGGSQKGSEGVGVIAQDVKGVIPYTVSTYKAKLNPEDAETTDLYNFDGSALTFVLINAVTDLDRENKTLKSELEDLRKRLESLEKSARKS